VNASLNEELPARVQQVAEGAHPFNALIGLATASDDRSDEQWLALYHEVSSMFGRPIAAAAARKRLSGPRSEPPTPAQAISRPTVERRAEATSARLAPAGPLQTLVE
jgi:hypothetical protein